jgi:hypothetical protein
MAEREDSLALTLISELPWLGIAMLGLTVALFIEHFFVHCQIIEPSLSVGGVVEPWMWGALATPELIACFLAGWRVRSWPAVVMYAGIAALVRDIFYVMLTVAGEPGHDLPQTFGQSVLSMAGVALWYLLAFGLASASWREDARPAVTSSLTGVPRQ